MPVSRNRIQRMAFSLVIVLMLGTLLAGCGGQQADVLRFPDFTLFDLDGNPVTQEIFARRDLTVVNVWGTYCPPCIKEMPDLGRLHTTLEAEYNATLVGIVVDVRDRETLGLARQILSDSQASHLNLLMGKDVHEFLSRYDYIPTTLFIDSKGNVVGDPVVGGFTHDEYLKEVKTRLNAR